MGIDSNRYGSYKSTRLPVEKRVIPLRGHLEDEGKYYRCWHCGFINHINKASIGPGSGVTVVSNLSLLLHMNGINGSTTFTDSSPQSVHTVTANGNAQISTAQYKFSTASGLFDGDGDYLTIPDNSDFDFSAGYWAIDFWIRGNWSGIGTEGIYFQRTDANNYFSIHVVKDAGGYGLALSIYASGSESVAFATGTPTLTSGTWHHVEVSEYLDNYRISVDGHMGWKLENSSVPANYTGSVYIGCTAASGSPANYFTGNLDEFRVMKYVTHFDGFTVPVAAYDTDAYIPGAYYPKVNSGCARCGSRNYR